MSVKPEMNQGFMVAPWDFIPIGILYDVIRDVWRSGTTSAANGEAEAPTVVVGRIDAGGAVEVEVVGAGAVRVWSRRPVVAVVAGVVE